MSEGKELVLAPASALSTETLEELEKLIKRASEDEGLVHAQSTLRAYKTQWRLFESWCKERSLPSFPAPPHVILVYLEARAAEGRGIQTLGQVLSAIREEHKRLGHPPPELDGKLLRAWRGLRKRVQADADEEDKARPLQPEELKRILDSISERDPLGLRDRALLLIGFLGAMRRSEIAGLDARNIKVEDEGLRVRIARSKTDQEGRGYVVAIAKSGDPAYCPVVAWERYFEQLDEEGPAFLSRTKKRIGGKDVNRILQRRAKRCGDDLTDLSGHSLRSGCITAAAKAGASLQDIQKQSRHRTLEVLLGYVRIATAFDEHNVSKGLL